MGSDRAELRRQSDEGPQREVAFRRVFALSQTEVTVRQWKQFETETKHVMERHDEPQGRCLRAAARLRHSERHPAVCILNGDANAYVAWLAQKTGKPYRLPSESEWEYAARAGSRKVYPWGDDPKQGCAHANVYDQSIPHDKFSSGRFECNDGFAEEAPVKTYQPNAFGLYDMIGNAAEWTEDCYAEGAYAGKAPSSGQAHVTPDCEVGVIRGGSWASSPGTARSAYRRSGNESSIGLRVALFIFQ
jgi:formylglycine-generating enzyme required for sulfatase activity